jgi:integrase
MIAISFYHRVDVLLPPVIKVTGVVEFALADRPDVERLINDEQTQAIACIEKSRRRRIVCRSDSIKARCLQELHLPLLCPIECRSTEWPAYLPTKRVAMTIAELGLRFQHRELARDDNWRSYSTRRNYEFYLRKWIIPRWGNYELGEVRTIEIESWLRSLPLARSSCAKIRNLMSVLFNHAWRHELFDNPITLVRPTAKRRAAPNVLAPAEIKLLLDHLDLRERTLVLLAASTGLRQSELFSLKWGDIEFSQGTMNVTRSIAMASSADARLKLLRSLCPSIQFLPSSLLGGEIAADIVSPTTGYSPTSIIGDKQFTAELSDLWRRESGLKKGSAGTPSAALIRRFYVVLERSSK